MNRKTAKEKMNNLAYLVMGYFMALGLGFMLGKYSNIWLFFAVLGIMFAAYVIIAVILSKRSGK